MSPQPTSPVQQVIHRPCMKFQTHGYFRSKENAGNKTSVPGHDHQELEKVFHIRSSGKQRK